MQEIDLKKLHKALLYITDEIDRVCSENGIIYTLTNGSLIGAVRHKGFIPWDDDMDIAMLREDYEKFKAVCKNELKSEFMWQDAECDKDYPYSFGKVVLKNTQCRALHHESEAWQKGIYVDVFPLDNVPVGMCARYFQAYKNFMLIKLIECKTGLNLTSKSIMKKVLFCLLYVISCVFSFSYLTGALQKNVLKYRFIESEKVCSFGGYWGYKKETTYREYFSEILRIPFENKKYNIISKYDDFLTAMYGEYMVLPPVEKRHTHDIAVLDFGPYDSIF